MRIELALNTREACLGDARERNHSYKKRKYSKDFQKKKKLCRKRVKTPQISSQDSEDLCCHMDNRIQILWRSNENDCFFGKYIAYHNSESWER